MKTQTLCLSLLLIYACTSEQKKQNAATSQVIHNQDVPVIDIDKAQEVSKLLFSSYFKAPKTIILETNDDCLIQSVGGVQVYQDKIFILDKGQKKLFVFDTNGNFVRTIGFEGNGPGEYLDISDFTINREDGIIFMLDDLSRKINKYDIGSGTYIGSINIEENDIQTFSIQYISGKIYTDAVLADKKKTAYLLKEIDLAEGKTTNMYLDASKYNKDWNLPMRNDDSFFYSRASSSPKFIQLFMDTIICLSKDRITPAFAIKSKKCAGHEDIKRINDIYDRTGGLYDFSTLYEEEKIFLINKYIEFDPFVCFQFMKGDNRHYLMHDKVNKKTMVSKFFVNDFISADNLIPMECCFNDSNGVYSLLRHDFLSHFIAMAAMGQIDPSINQYDRLLKITEDANPILFYHEYKDTSSGVNL